jgi:hypothetical protein
VDPERTEAQAEALTLVLHRLPIILRDARKD